MGTLQGGAFPPIDFPLCDVRDVAKAHLEACVRDEAKNMRFIVAQPRPFADIGRVLVPKYGENYPIITKELGMGMITFFAIFMKDVAQIKKRVGVKTSFDTSLTNDVLGI